MGDLITLKCPVSHGSPERIDSTDSGISDNEYASEFSEQETPSPSYGKLDNVKNEIKETSTQLALWVISEMTNKKPIPSISEELRKHVPVLKRIIDRLMISNEKTLKGMVKQLKIDNVNSSKCCLKKVANELFNDGNCNWGRIVTLYAFAGEIARSLQPQYGDKADEEIAKELGVFVSSRLSLWITGQGGWDALNEFFVEENQTESKLWKGLLCAMIGFGAIATTALIMR